MTRKVQRRTTTKDAQIAPENATFMAVPSGWCMTGHCKGCKVMFTNAAGKPVACNHFCHTA